MDEIKRLNDNHTKEAIQLIQIFQEESTENDTRVASEDWIRTILTNKDFIVLTAITKGEIIGGLTAFKLHMYKRNTSKFLLYEIGVKQKVRRKGIGNILLKKLKKIAYHEGISEILVITSNTNHEAIEFYKSTGGRLIDNSVIFKYYQ